MRDVLRMVGPLCLRSLRPRHRRRLRGASLTEDQAAALEPGDTVVASVSIYEMRATVHRRIWSHGRDGGAGWMIYTRERVAGVDSFVPSELQLP